MNKLVSLLLIQFIGSCLLYAGDYTESYRPQYHFSPNSGLIGDPDGLIKYDDNYHLFWWGHAISKDLVYWQELPWGMPDLGAGYQYFSGSIIIDKSNNSGLKSGEFPPALAFTTHHEVATDMEYPYVVYSNEHINNFQNFSKATDVAVSWDLRTQNGDIHERYLNRDPQVFWYNDRWLMVLANNSVADGRHIELLQSWNLKEWWWRANFKWGTDMLECPDLFPVTTDGVTQWVMTYGMSDHTYYQFVNIDIDNGTADNRLIATSDPYVLDNGQDFYAARVYRDYDGDLASTIIQAWLGSNLYKNELDAFLNWGPGQISLPRKLSVKSVNGVNRLVQSPISQLHKLRKDSVIQGAFDLAQPWGNLPHFQPESNQYEMFISFDVNAQPNTDVTLNFCFAGNPTYNKVSLHYIASTNTYWLDRRSSDNVASIANFSSEVSAQVYPTNGIVSFRIFVDKSSIEVFGNEGESSITSQILPFDTSVSIEASTGGESTYGTAKVVSLKGYNLNSIWTTTTKEKQSIYNKVIYDGENTKPHFYSLSGSDPNGSDMGPENWQLTLNDATVVNILEPEFTNPIKKGINTSDKVMRFYRSKNGKSWCGCALGNLYPETDNTWAVTLKINKPTAGRVIVKLEGGTNTDGNPGSEEVSVDYNTPGEWAKLRFGFNNWNFSQGEPGTVLIFPHYEDTDISPLDEAIPIYIDDIEIRNDVLLSTDLFRTKASGNWSNLSSWESAMADNASWQWNLHSSEFIPDQRAINVNIQNGHTLTVNNNAAAGSVTIQPTGRLTLSEGNSLSVNTINMESTADGTASFIDNSGNGLTMTSNAIVKQNLNAARSWYISSPVQNATPDMLNSNKSMIASFTESTRTWNYLTDSTTLKAGRGYITNINAANTVEFSGVFNSGNINVQITGNDKRFNLVGNPYPSYLNFDQLAASNNTIENTFWFRTKNISDSYLFATYNSSSQLSVAPDANTGIYNLIPPMQAFWIRSAGTESSTLTFTDAMRSHPVNADNKFKVSSNIQRPLLRMQVNTANKTDEILIYFDKNASDKFDRFDSEKMFSGISGQPEIWTFVDDNKLVINGLNEISDNLSIPVFVKNTGEKYKICIKEIQNIPEGTQVYLTNTATGESVNLSDVSDLEVTPGSTDQDQLLLNFKVSGSVTANDQIEKRSQIQVTNGIQNIPIEISWKNTINMTLLDLSGKIIWSDQYKTLPANILVPVSKGVYILRSQSDDKTSSHKLIFK